MILDTFLILFDGDATKAKLAMQAAEQAGEQSAEKIVAAHEKARKKVEEEQGHVNKLGHAFDQLGERAVESGRKIVEQLAEVAAGFAALLGIEKLVEGFFEQAEASQKLGEQAKQLGLNVGQLDAWGQAVRREGGSAEAFVGSIQTLTLSLQRLAIGAPLRGKRFFEALGITNPEKELNDIFGLFPKLAEKVQNMPRAQSFAMLRGIGLDEATIRLIQNGGKELDELIERQKKLGLITNEDTEIAKKFNIEWMDVKQILRSVAIEADTAFLPFLGEMLKGVETFFLFLRDHKDLVVGFFIGLGAATLVVTEAVWGLNAAFLANPITWVIIGIGLLITAFAFLYDDIKAFKAGHNSLIGEMIKQYPMLDTAIRKIGDAYHYVEDAFDIFHKKQDEILDKLSAKWGTFGQVIQRMVKFFEDFTFAAATFDFSGMRKALGDLAAPYDDTGGAFGGGSGSSSSGGFHPSGGSGKADSDAATDERAKQIHDGLVARGMDSNSAWGFAGNAIQESRAKWNSRPGDMGAAHGAFMWRDDRLNAFKSQYGHLPEEGNLDEQLDFVMKELHGSENKAWNNIQKAGNSAGEKGAAVSFFYERPKDTNAEMGRRWELSQHLANLEAGKGFLNSTNSPLMAQTATSLAMRNSSNSNSLVTGDVHLHSSTDDPKSFTDQFVEHLNKHYNDVMPNYADGVQY